MSTANVRRIELEPIGERELEILRAVPGEARVQSLDTLYAQAVALMRAQVREHHPEWSDERVRAEAVRRIADVDE
ncbi:MAG: hypothetical protein EA378_02730 [Phycisphaerales bacterium]|nr:MAG: hypothetical protein EA378_02730 [Phycisphaerales bacterium]